MKYKIPVDIINILYICSHILNKLNEVIQRRNWVFNSSSTFVSFLYFLAQSEMNFFFKCYNEKICHDLKYQAQYGFWLSKSWKHTKQNLTISCLLNYDDNAFILWCCSDITYNFFYDINRLLCFCTTHFTFNHNINHLTCTFDMNIFISEFRFTNIFLIIKLKGKLTLLSSIDEIYE